MFINYQWGQFQWKSSGFQTRIFLQLGSPNKFLWLHMLGVLQKFGGLISCNSVLAPHFHGETWIPKCTSIRNLLKNMDHQLQLIWKPAKDINHTELKSVMQKNILLKLYPLPAARKLSTYYNFLCILQHIELHYNIAQLFARNLTVTLIKRDSNMRVVKPNVWYQPGIKWLMLVAAAGFLWWTGPTLVGNKDTFSGQQRPIQGYKEEFA